MPPDRRNTNSILPFRLSSIIKLEHSSNRPSSRSSREPRPDDSPAPSSGLRREEGWRGHHHDRAKGEDMGTVEPPIGGLGRLLGSAFIQFLYHSLVHQPVTRSASLDTGMSPSNNKLPMKLAQLAVYPLRPLRNTLMMASGRNRAIKQIFRANPRSDRLRNVCRQAVKRASQQRQLLKASGQSVRPNTFLGAYGQRESEKDIAPDASSSYSSRSR